MTLVPMAKMEWPTCRRGHPLTPENRRADNGACRECRRAAARARYARSDKQRNANRAWREANPDRIAEHRRRTAAKPETKAKQQAWRQRNADKLLEYSRRWTENNREKTRQKAREVTIPSQ